ncbi:unnamed protein product [Phyllotreta striolata]|uniref:G-protein coupled receptors family 2 profile 2 domain-containing protein n=1 Tax=Phyllotreta striolata TaxID=444603 RepID=A0A9N9TJU0_PHYSR|nr:unnamed protein product [Phyllotreta striolata]
MEVRVLLAFSSILALCCSQQPTPCHPSLTVDISAAEKSANRPDAFLHDGLIYEKKDYFISENGTRLGCICNVKRCFRKCCPLGEYMKREGILDHPPMNDDEYACAPSNSTLSVNIHNKTTISDGLTMSNFSITVGKECLVDQHFRSIETANEFLYLQENGSLYYDDEVIQEFYDIGLYCIDDFEGNSWAFMCSYNDSASNDRADMERIVKAASMLVSAPFLVCTFLVYVILPERNLHRYALMCYIVSLLGGNSTLVLLQFYGLQWPLVSCRIIGYSIIFFYLASFAWLNALCIDMSLAFSSWTGFLSKKTSERRKFIFYSFYAWGASMFFVLLVFLLSKFMDEHSKFRPNVGEGVCFLNGFYQNLLYFYLPMTVLVVINIAAFVFTFWKIYKIKKETKMLKRSDSRIHSHNDDNQKFKLYLKLVFAMGLNWSMEIISWFVKWECPAAPDELFYATDLINTLYGIIIFFIFVFKKKIIRSLQKRLNKLFGRPQLTPRTSAKSSRTQYSDTMLSTTDYTSSSPSVFRQPEWVPLKQR